MAETTRQLSSAGGMITVDLDTGNRTVLSSTTVGNGPPLGTVLASALDSAGNRVLAVGQNDWGLVAVDLTSGDRTLLSGATKGTGPEFTGSESIALDLANDRALVVDQSTDTIISVGKTNGDPAPTPSSR